MVPASLNKTHSAIRQHVFASYEEAKQTDGLLEERIVEHLHAADERKKLFSEIPRIEGERIVLDRVIDTDADVDRFINSDMVFLEEGTPLDASPFFIEDYSNVTLLYERQFIDENGNIYEIIDEPLKGEKTCIHNYVNGTAQIHERHQNVGCTMTCNSAQRCTKCGNVLLGDILNVINYSVCNH